MLHVKEIGISSACLGLKLACTFTFFFLAVGGGGGGGGRGGGKDSLVTTTLRRQLAQNFVSLNSPMMQFHITSTQSPRKLKIVNRGHLARLMNAKAVGIVQRDR